jgi:hypothetical protein
LVAEEYRECGVFPGFCEGHPQVVGTTAGGGLRPHGISLPHYCTTHLSADGAEKADGQWAELNLLHLPDPLIPVNAQGGGSDVK